MTGARGAIERSALIASRTTRRFWRLFSGLPFDVPQDANLAYRLFRGNPAHPGLQFKKREGEDDLYSVRIGLDYRALAVMRKISFVWFWIGSMQNMIA